MEEAVKEYLAPIKANNALTQETKAVIAEHVAKFAQFIENRQKSKKAE